MAVGSPQTEERPDRSLPGGFSKLLAKDGRWSVVAAASLIALTGGSFAAVPLLRHGH